MNWYPKKYCKTPATVTRAKIMKYAYLEGGFNAKQIAGYFNLSLNQTYHSLNVKKLKVMVLEKRLND